MKYLWCIFIHPQAFWMGLSDAYKQGHLESGVTWDDWRINESYDWGANFGESFARLFKRSK